MISAIIVAAVSVPIPRICFKTCTAALSVVSTSNIRVISACSALNRSICWVLLRSNRAIAAETAGKLPASVRSCSALRCFHWPKSGFQDFFREFDLRMASPEGQVQIRAGQAKQFAQTVDFRCHPLGLPLVATGEKLKLRLGKPHPPVALRLALRNLSVTAGWKE